MKKIITAILVIAILLGGTAMAFSYWDNLQTQDSQTISVGQGVTLTVTADATAPEGSYLVPVGAVLKTNDVNEIVLTYNVKLDQEAQSALDLTVTASNVLIGGLSDNASLVNISIVQAASTVNNTDVLVTITVTLTEPATEAIYNAIINQDITFDLTFTAA